MVYIHRTNRSGPGGGEAQAQHGEMLQLRQGTSRLTDFKRTANAIHRARFSPFSCYSSRLASLPSLKSEISTKVNFFFPFFFSKGCTSSYSECSLSAEATTRSSGATEVTPQPGGNQDGEKGNALSAAARRHAKNPPVPVPEPDQRLQLRQTDKCRPEWKLNTVWPKRSWKRSL